MVIDDKVKEGYWKGEQNSHYKFRGRMAKFPDKHTSEMIEGGAVRLLGRRSPTRPGVGIANPAEGIDPAADPATTVADAEKQARAHAAKLLPQAGELHCHVRKLQGHLASVRKDAERVGRAVSDLRGPIIESGKQIDLFPIQAEYNRLATAYELETKQIGRTLEAAVAEQKGRRADPVASFIESRRSLEKAVKALVEDKGGANNTDIHAEHFRKELADLRKRGPGRVEEPSPEFLADQKARREKVYQELRGNAFELTRLKRMHADEDRLDAATRAADQEQRVREYEKRVKSLNQSIAEAEAAARGQVNTATKVLADRVPGVLASLSTPSVEELRQSWDETRKHYAALSAAMKEMRGRVERIRPVAPKDLWGQLE